MNNIKLIPQNYKISEFYQAQKLLKEFALNTSVSNPVVGAKESAVVIGYLSKLLDESRELLKLAKDFGIDEMSLEDRAAWEGKVESSLSTNKSLNNIPISVNSQNNIISIF